MSPLYRKHDTHGLQTTILGMRGLSLYRLRLKGYGTERWARGNYILMLGPVSLSWGPSGGVEEGRASIPDEELRWGRCWWSNDGGRAYAIDWTRNA